MKILMLCFILWFSYLNALDIGHWHSVRKSGKLSSNDVLLRTEITRPNLVTNKLLYNAGSGVLEYDLSLINASSSTYQASIPIGQQRRYFGLKQATSSSVNSIIPVYFPGIGLPALGDLSKVSTDAANDQSTNYLDIVADYVTIADNRIITGIQNRGGGFPTSGSFGTVYFSYMSVIADPASDPQDPNTIVWALNYMNVSLGGISPGLYKITGSGTSDLIRLGNIQTQIVSGSNLLIMSCNLSDLMADPDFAAWYNPQNPNFGMQTIANRTTVIPFATTMSDSSPGARVYPQILYADPVDYSATSIANIQFVREADDLYFECYYQNPDNLFPVETSFAVEGGTSFPMYEDSFDYSQSVRFRTANLMGLLPEVDNGYGRIFTGDPAAPMMSLPLLYSYILGVAEPLEIQISYQGVDIQISWQAVSQTLLGNPLTVSRYRVEASATPHFESFEVLGVTEDTVYLLPQINAGIKRFFRVVAVKDMP